MLAPCEVAIAWYKAGRLVVHGRYPNLQSIFQGSVWHELVDEAFGRGWTAGVANQSDEVGVAKPGEGGREGGREGEERVQCAVT